MQREIKFRAFWKDAKMMVNVESLRPNGGIEFFVEVQSGDKKWDEHQVLDEIDQYDLMQYTGLKDKNGKEIYEGDIVKAKSYGQEIIFKIEWIGMTGCGCHNGYGYSIPDENNDPYEWEVVGNIYENPELINN